MAQLGFTSNDVGGSVQTAFRASDRSGSYEGGEEYPINLRMDQADRQDISRNSGRW